MLSTLNRTILWELSRIFLLALVSITGILLLAVVVMEAQSQGLGPLQILAIIPLVIPSTLPYTIPATTLFATCIVYGRLAHDNEILAIKAAGINLLHVVKPALILGLSMSIVTAFLYHQIIPRTYNMMKTMFLDDVEGLLYTMLSNRGCFSHPKLDYVMYVKRVQGRKLINAQFMHRDTKAGYHFDGVARAREAEIRIHKTNDKVKGLIYMRHCYIVGRGNEGSAYLADKVWEIDFPPDFAKADRRYCRTDMTWEQLVDRREELQKEIEKKDAEIGLTMSRLTVATAPGELPKHLENLRNVRKFLFQQLRDVDAEVQRRPALALGCLCFVLVGCPVGIWFSRSDYLSAFVTCFLPIVMIYYPLVLCGENLARTGTVNPVLALWTADILMGLVALVLYRKLVRN